VIDLFKTAKTVQDFILSKNWNFCFIGGLAIQRWGINRLTDDVDLTIITGFGNEKSYIQELLGAFNPRIDDALEFALQNRVVLIEDKTGVGIDISLGAFEFEEQAVERASDYQFLPEISLRVCSAEDLIIYKCFANRDQDWVDVRGILENNLNTLDFKHIESLLPPLLELKEEPEIYEKFNNLKSKICSRVYKN
jgi:hypothetical protein